MPANLCDLKHTEERERHNAESEAGKRAWDKYGVGPGTPRPEPPKGMTQRDEDELWNMRLRLYNFAELKGWEQEAVERLLKARTLIGEAEAVQKAAQEKRA